MQDQTENTFCCLLCLGHPQQPSQLTLPCGHTFCQPCITNYITVLKQYKQLTPQKLKCLHQNCQQELSDELLQKLFPGQQGFILKIIKKCYKDSKNPANVIFCCGGMVKTDRKTIVEKSGDMSREQHTKLMNESVRKIKEEGTSEGVKGCTNIHTYNKTLMTKDKYVLCYVCGCSFCLTCLELSHQGKCAQKIFHPLLDKKVVQSNDNFQNFLDSNQILSCLNPKCGVAIAKEEGCYWVKCRCSWEMCYPCQKLWGNCQHFSKYPYQKFTPPSDWMVKALRLY